MIILLIFVIIILHPDFWFLEPKMVLFFNRPRSFYYLMRATIHKCWDLELVSSLASRPSDFVKSELRVTGYSMCVHKQFSTVGHIDAIKLELYSGLTDGLSTELWAYCLLEK